MPFFRLSAPSISLALLEAALRRAGFGCDLCYLNLDFGQRIGRALYDWIALSAPQYLLFGDLVFAPLLNDVEISPERLRQLIAALQTRSEGGVPEQVVERFGSLVQDARHFVAEALRSIRWTDYDLVGLGTVHNVAAPLALARHLKKQVADPPLVILGGSHCEGELGEHLHRRFPFVDFVCRGEGEQLIVQLAQALRDGTPLHAIPGLVWRDAQQTRCNGDKASIGPEDLVSAPAAEHILDQLPVPRYDGWLEQVRSGDLLSPEELRLPLETSRGCWYGEKHHCIFCGLNGATIAFRRKSPARILQELAALRRTGVHCYNCVDNIFDHRHFKTLLPKLQDISGGCEIFWPVRPSMTREQLALLARCGILWTQSGIESLSSAVLALMGKRITALQNVRFLRDAAELQAGTSWNLLFGFVGEEASHYQEMAQLMPSLEHLQPPRGSYQLRLDRFSPVFEQRRGLHNVRPVPAYREVFRFDEETVSRLAYYFDYEYADARDPHAYVAGCQQAIDRWRRAVGQAALLCYEAGDALHVVDSRAIATHRRGVLRGLEKEIYRAADRGASREEIARRTGRPPEQLHRHLEPLLARRWLAHLDGRFLALAVPVDSWVPRKVPPVLVEEALVARYRQKMAELCALSRGVAPLKQQV